MTINATRGTATNAQPPSVARGRLQNVRARLLTPEFAIVPVLVVVAIVGVSVNAAFLSYDNIFGMLQQASELAILVMALTLVLITNRFDLSLESTFGLAVLAGCYLFLGGASGALGLADSPVLALLATFVIAALIGAFNGLLVVYLRFNAFIATLAVMMLLRGISLGLTKGQTLSGLPPEIVSLGQSSVAGVPSSLIVALLVLVVLTVFLTRHRLGRTIYAIGGNSQAARVSGARVERIVFGVFVVAAMLAALAGLLQAGRIASVPTSLGDGLIFSAFAAAVLGGVSLNGGKGSMLGACGGVVLLVMIQNLLVLSKVPSYWIDATTGAIILIALFIARLSGSEKEKA